ncbi:Bicupin, oxalate decarboxylase/oxidase [Cordyceps fumosorosea ARSEF 2679]|uniref:Bicupin, oxalate decarboxylase/oxidase n=1 Tax=Cordyceps fumosorosea (strain ARSEF 2679) TaxID=1081104 RepID=A0A167RJV7_CORFA|nr:Bicupin, oxalate decarboxylase/oxidase [Cordyceps fumosorosea ARSEF 2679]OAA58666.1 Bicupin, oxalate decarboxylase/oxidase [Cordyceps fumosorosea ARSEF 2679]
MIFSSQALLLLLSLTGSAYGAPQIKYAGNQGPIAGVGSSSVAEVQAPIGSLRGDSSLLGGNAPIPDTSQSSADVSDPTLVAGQGADADLGLYLDLDSVAQPEPFRGDHGSSAAAARTYAYEKLNPDVFAPPGTDAGSVPNAVWPMGLSHNRLGTGTRSGWARQQNTDVLPGATAMAGVDMKLAPHAYRELHWHTAAEWALVLEGCVRVAAVDDEGRSFTDDLCAGDVWFFPAGVPHSIQAFEKGVEFLLVFDQGDFDENGTFLVSEMFARTPTSVLAKNFDDAPVEAFRDLPKKELYIFNGTPQPRDIREQTVTGPAGGVPPERAYTYHWSAQEAWEAPGGTVKILDPTTFPVAAGFSAALVTVRPGAMREMHWHTSSDEWDYFLRGSGRATVYRAPDAARTFDFTAGDVGYVPRADAHYVENTGTEDLVFLEVLQAPKFTDISVAQWLALTPKQTVKDHLNLPDSLLDGIPKQKTLLKQGNTNMTALAG